VKDVFIEPDLADDTASFHLKLVHAGNNTTSAKIPPADKMLYNLIEFAMPSDDATLSAKNVFEKGV
jgi:hypothetical protein